MVKKNKKQKRERDGGVWSWVAGKKFVQVGNCAGIKKFNLFLIFKNIFHILLHSY